MSRRTSPHAVVHELAVCQACTSDLVEPTRWEPADGLHWRVSLRCPNCTHTSEGLYTQECVERLDRRLDEGAGSIVRDLRRLELANMEHDCERFIGAIGAGAILPEDFGGGAR